MEMEIETVLIGNPEEALEIINRIRNLGVRIALTTSAPVILPSTT